MAEESEQQPTPGPEPTQRSSLPGLIVVGALIGFGALLFLANFSGQVSDPGRRARKDNAFATETQNRGKAKRPPPKLEILSPEQLVVEGPPIERAAAPQGARNVVMVIPTALRRDHLEPYGAPAGQSPRIQALAAQGVRFADVIAASPFSRTAGVAWLTGQHAATLDMVEPAPGPNHRVLPDEASTFVEQLRASGWGTYGVTGNFNLNTDAGLSQGFDRFHDSQKQGFHPKARVDGDVVVGAALELLDERADDEKGRPFFLLVDLIDAHPPRKPVKNLDPFEPEKPGAEYRATVQRLDGVVGQLLDGLKERGHAPDTDTIVVLLGDHGTGAGMPEHHGQMHGRTLYESSVLVPWIVAGPGLPKNHVVGGIASQTDFGPTVLDLVGLKPPKDVDGRSWAAQVRGEKPRTDREVAFSDTWYFNANRASIWTPERQCQKDYGSVGVEDVFAQGCFDRRTDPDFTNVIGDEALMARLDEWRGQVSQHVTERAPIDDPEGGGEEGEEGGEG